MTTVFSRHCIGFLSFEAPGRGSTSSAVSTTRSGHGTPRPCRREGNAERRNPENQASSSRCRASAEAAPEAVRSRAASAACNACRRAFNRGAKHGIGSAKQQQAQPPAPETPAASPAPGRRPMLRASGGRAYASRGYHPTAGHTPCGLSRSPPRRPHSTRRPARSLRRPAHGQHGLQPLLPDKGGRAARRTPQKGLGSASDTGNDLAALRLCDDPWPQTTNTARAFFAVARPVGGKDAARHMKTSVRHSSAEVNSARTKSDPVQYAWQQFHSITVGLMNTLSVRSTLLRFSLPKNHLIIGTRARNGMPREDFSSELRSSPPRSTISSFCTLTIDLKPRVAVPGGASSCSRPVNSVCSNSISSVMLPVET